MLALLSVAALVFAHFLPGLLVVKLADIGRSREERLVLAAVVGGPVAAAVYLICLLARWDPLYWILVVNLDVLALVVPYRTKRAWALSGARRLALVGLVCAVAVPYLLTTGSLYQRDESGTLLLDVALQRDVLFHVGIVRSLEHAYPPSLLSLSGTPVGYHVAYHLQLAAWARYFGIDAMDGLVRPGTLWQLALLVMSAFVLATRFSERASAQLLTPLLVLCAGFGFVFFSRPSVDWWSLVFMDVTLVSVLLANPLLPALPLLFCGLVLIDDYTRGEGRGSLAGAALCVAFLLVTKMFVGAQVLAALGAASLVRLRDRRLLTATVVISCASAPFLLHTLLAAEGSNTSVGVRPLEIVRYSMEKLDAAALTEALARVGQFELTAGTLSLSLAATLLWLLGFAGLRVVGARGWLRDLSGGASSLRRTMSWFVLIGFPIALTFRIAPAEADGLSRLEAQNDVVWFAATSGVLLWFWTAEALRGRLAAPAVLLLALPCTVQHFAYHATLEPDRVASDRVFAARLARVLSPQDAVWLDPPDRARPSLLPYVGGRAVVYDPYVGYDYMFVGREEVDFRRHAVAQFWQSRDPAYRAWVIDHFDVDFVWQPRSESVLRGLEAVHTSDSINLFRVNEFAIFRAGLAGIRSPESIPIGGAGASFFGAGFQRDGHVRALEPGVSHLYLPRAVGADMRLTFRFQPGHGGGGLVVAGVRYEVAAEALAVEVLLPPREENGLHAIGVEWTGNRPLRLFELRIRS